MKMKKYLTNIIIAILLILTSVTSCDKKEAESIVSISVTEVKVEPTTITLILEDKQQLTASITPENATNKKIFWISSNPKVATVNENGLVSAVAIGRTTITATTEDGNKSAKCEIVVDENFYDKYCYGFLVNDTVDLTVMGMRDDLEDILLFGIKSKKFWISKFNRETKKYIKEYITKDDFPLSVQIHLGYGETKQVAINKIQLGDFYETNIGFAAKIDCNEQVLCYVFSVAEHSKYYFNKDLSSGPSRKLFNWFENSFIARINVSNELYTDDAYTCFSENGDVIFTKKSNFYITDNSFPLNYEDFAQHFQMYNFDEENIRPCISMLKYGIREDTNYKKSDIYILSNKEDKYSIVYKKYENGVLEFDLHVDKYNGTKDNVKYEIDVESWKFSIKE